MGATSSREDIKRLVAWLLEGMAGYQKSLGEVAKLLTGDQFAQLSEQAAYDARMLFRCRIAGPVRLLRNGISQNTGS